MGLSVEELSGKQVLATSSAKGVDPNLNLLPGATKEASSSSIGPPPGFKSMPKKLKCIKNRRRKAIPDSSSSDHTQEFSPGGCTKLIGGRKMFYDKFFQPVLSGPEEAPLLIQDCRFSSSHLQRQRLEHRTKRQAYNRHKASERTTQKLRIAQSYYDYHQASTPSGRHAYICFC